MISKFKDQANYITEVWILGSLDSQTYIIIFYWQKYKSLKTYLSYIYNVGLYMQQKCNGVVPTMSPRAAMILK